jgi:hypothetical protein
MRTNKIKDNESDTKLFRAAGTAVHQKIVRFLDSVKRRVFGEYRAALGFNESLLRLAISEAEAIAWQTGYPHLVFPQLAVEKAQDAVRWQFRQSSRLRSQDGMGS